MSLKPPAAREPMVNIRVNLKDKEQNTRILKEKKGIFMDFNLTLRTLLKKERYINLLVVVIP